MDLKRSRVLVFLVLVLTLSLSSFDESPLKKDEWKELRQDHTYVQKVAEEQDSGSPFLKGFFATLLGSTAYLIGIILILAILGFLVYLLVKNSGKIKIGSSNKNKEISDISDADLLDEDLTYNQLEKALQQAKLARNFRLCIGIIYQMCIKKMSETGLVNYNPEKTNWDYVSELNSKNNSGIFGQLTVLHEVIWYGNSPLDDTKYTLLEGQFEKFLKSKIFEG